MRTCRMAARGGLPRFTLNIHQTATWSAPLRDSMCASGHLNIIMCHLSQGSNIYLFLTYCNLSKCATDYNIKNQHCRQTSNKVFYSHHANYADHINIIMTLCPSINSNLPLSHHRKKKPTNSTSVDVKIIIMIWPLALIDHDFSFCIWVRWEAVLYL